MEVSEARAAPVAELAAAASVETVDEGETRMRTAVEMAAMRERGARPVVRHQRQLQDRERVVREAMEEMQGRIARAEMEVEVGMAVHH